MNLRDVERVLRIACAGRIPDDYAAMTARTAMALANAIEAIDRQQKCVCPCHDSQSPTVLHGTPCCAAIASATGEKL